MIVNPLDRIFQGLASVPRRRIIAFLSQTALSTSDLAGRFGMSTNLYDLVGKHNMALTYVRLALGEPVDLRDEYDASEGYYMVRDLDTLTGIFHADDFFDGIEDARP